MVEGCVLSTSEILGVTLSVLSTVSNTCDGTGAETRRPAVYVKIQGAKKQGHCFSLRLIIIASTRLEDFRLKLLWNLERGAQRAHIVVKRCLLISYTITLEIAIFLIGKRKLWRI